MYLELVLLLRTYIPGIKAKLKLADLASTVYSLLIDFCSYNKVLKKSSLFQNLRTTNVKKTARETING